MHHLPQNLALMKYPTRWYVSPYIYPLTYNAITLVHLRQLLHTQKKL